MLTIEVQTLEGFDEATQKFVSAETFRLDLEHSLVSLSKWEAIFEKPFLTDKEKSSEETLAYIKMMTLTPDVPPEVFQKLGSPENAHNIEKISDYINSKQTATTFPAENGPPNREIITAELIYYWMISLNVPLEWENRHLRRLLTLLRVCNVKSSPPKKMGRQEMLAERKALNEQRKKQWNTTG